MELLTGFVVCVIFLLLWKLTRRPSLFPPGPALIPIIGNILSLDKDPRVAFSKLRGRYGDVFSFYVFHKPIVVLTGYDTLKKALVKHGDVFSDRPHGILFTEYIGTRRGVVSTSGTVWKEQRKFALSTLRDLGMGKSVLEDKIQEELVVFLKALGNEQGQPFDPTHLLQNAVSNIICSVAFGKRFDYDDQVFQNNLMKVEDVVTFLGNSDFVNSFPSLIHLPGDLFGIKAVLRKLNEMKTNFIDTSIAAHIKSRTDHETDFIAAYINEMDSRGEHETSMNRENLIQMITDLFVAGTETSSTTIRWLLVYFLNYPEVQMKCFEEIEENIGLNRPPSMKDKTSLPYLEATIHETLRHADIVPASVPHAVSEDVDFQGYLIPKGTTIITMLDSVLQDPEIWGDPENFRPERFLDDDGKFQRKEEFVPFSLGRRVCLGEPLARMELFLFLASMIQRFEFLSAHPVKPSIEGLLSITHKPKSYKIIAKPRK